MEAVKKKKSKKKLVITLVIIAVVIAVIFGACAAMGSAARKAMAEMTAMQTGRVEVRELVKSIGATGTVISVERKDVTATLSGCEIDEILVEVGDTVEEGQLLARFDTEDIAENLAIAQRALGQTQGQLGITADNAQRQVADAIRGGEYSVDMARQNVDAAYDAYLDSWDALEDAKDAANDAREAYWEAEDALEELLEQQPEENTMDFAAVQLQIYQLEQTLPQLEAAVEQTEQGVEQAEKAIDTLYDQYETAQKNYENTVANGESSVAAAQAAQQSAQLSANTDQQQKQVDSLMEQLDKGQLTAPISGVVTAVNFDDGDTYTQGAIVTIQDCSRFEVRAQIGEYDISDIALGQKVLLKTEATRDQELEGTVVFISPTATQIVSTMGMQSVSADPTYEVRISVDTETDRLRLDMSANLSIIIREETAAMTVPYNAVQTAEDGSTFVEVVGEDDTTTVVPVEVVMESSYYTQIKGDLTEGQSVRIISREATDIFAEMMEMSPMAGGF